MPETLTFLLRAAALPTEAIAPAVRLAAELSVTITLSEDKAIAAAHVRTTVWDRIRPHLTELFEFSGGKVRMREAEDLDGLDLLALRTAAKEKRQRPTRPSNDPRVHALIALEMPEREAKKFVEFAVRTYGEGHFMAALETAQKKKPLNAKSFMLAVIQNRINPGGASASGTEPKRVMRQIRVSNPEAARSERLGWEAPTFDALGVPSYPTGTRREVWRTRIGVAQYQDVGPGTKIPTPHDDPGVIIVETLR